jgi:hypoxanthine phosphoribosyltransferase
MIDRVLIDRRAIADRVQGLAAEVARDEAGGRGLGDELIVVPVLTGALVFAADLVRRLPGPLVIRPAVISCYDGSRTSPGEARLEVVPSGLTGRRVLIVDDILDSGRTLSAIRRAVLNQQPRSVRLCALLRKPGSRREVDVALDYVGFDIPDVFVVGYGLDFAGGHRNLPDVVVLAERSR